VDLTNLCLRIKTELNFLSIRFNGNLLLAVVNVWTPTIMNEMNCAISVVVSVTVNGKLQYGVHWKSVFTFR
jgi:hypothetical protein